MKKINVPSEDTPKASKSLMATKRHSSRSRTNESIKVEDELADYDEPAKLEIFTNALRRNSLPQGAIGLTISPTTQQIFHIKVDDQLTQNKPAAQLKKADILKDIELRRNASEFHSLQQEISSYPGEEIMVVYDAESRFDHNFILILCENTRLKFLNPLEDVSDAMTEQELPEDDEASDSVTVYHPKTWHPWESLGSEREIQEACVVETRHKIHTIYQRLRREFGKPITFTDYNAIDKAASSLVTSVPEKAPEIPILELDKGVSNAQLMCETGTNTDWKYPRNAFTQYTPRMYTAEELQTYFASSGILQDVGKHYPMVEESLLQNMMFDFLQSDFETLAHGDETYDSRADNTFKEFLSFSDLKFSKDKAVTDIQWHPTIKGIIGMSVGERINYDHRCDQMSRILLTPTQIVLWSFADPIQPQLILEAPEDILCFQFNPTDPNIVAGGCFNGMVVLWDIENYMEHLRTVKARMKTKNKPPLFSFDDTDPNKVPVSPYCACSNIEASHSSPIMDIKWVPDHFEINRLGHCLENPSLKCVQLLTCGLNGEILFWDIRPDRSPLAVDKSRDVNMQPRNVPTTFSALDMKWKPLLRVRLYRTDPSVGDHSPTKFCIKEVQGDRRILAANAEDKTFSTTRTNTAKNKVLQGVSTMIYAGTEDGDLVYVDWLPHKDQDTGKMQTPKPEFYAQQHDGPIKYLGRSPFDPTVLLVVGGWTWSLWKEGVNSGPILESGHSSRPLTGGSWSPTRPSVFFICRADGSLEAWDLLDKTHEPAMIQSVSANALTAISLCNFSRRQIVAIGDMQGALLLFVVPRRLKTMLAQELVNFDEYIKREVKRREFVAMRWNLREQERVQREAEAKRQAGIAAISLTEEEILQKEALEYEEFLRNEHAFLRQLGLLEA